MVGTLSPGAFAPAVTVAPATAVITVSSGEAFSGGYAETYHADDSVTFSASVPGQAAAGHTTQAVAGTFAAASGVIAAQGRAVQRKVDPKTVYCPDYGVDAVQADPPIAGFSGVATGCANADVTGLIDAIHAAVAALP